MSSREALQRALRDLYANSWRLVAVNAAFGALLVCVGLLAVVVHAALVLLVLAGPLLAALAHSAVVLQRTGNLTVRDGLEGLALHWRRGLVLGAGGAGLLALGALAIGVYARHGALVLAVVTLYVLLLAALVGLVLTVLAVAEPERPLRELTLQAARVVASRPRAALGLWASDFFPAATDRRSWSVRVPTASTRIRPIF